VKGEIVVGVQRTKPTQLMGLPTAIFIVVANMIGSGIFTSLGFQVVAIRSVFALLVLWLLGGLYALCGALAYGELARAMPASGGEYHFLTRLYHPAVGFLAGWVSATVGFAAPVAAASMAFGKYVSRVVPAISPMFAALAVATLVSLVHLGTLRMRSLFQGLATMVKLALLLGLVLCGLLLAKGATISLVPNRADWEACLSPAFAVSLVYVTYSYSGWNASVYLAGEVRSPERTVPRSLVFGTAIVTVLYVLVTFVFLYTTPMDALKGQVEIGYIVGEHLFGRVGATVMGLLIAMGLVSAVSSMTWAGPRVLGALANDWSSFRSLAVTNRHDVPYRALGVQWGIVILLVLSSTFESVITYLGFTLSVCTFMTVLGVFWLPRVVPLARERRSVIATRVAPVIFLGMTAWMLVYVFWYRSTESLLGLATLLVGLLVYTFAKRNAAVSSAQSGVSTVIPPPNLR
jgi:APA family basic amino acid/polyamine antiporter